MARRGRETSPFWQIAGWPLGFSVSCLLAGWLVGALLIDTPPNCDFSCAMDFGWQVYLAFSLLGTGVLAFGVFILVCLFLWVGMAVSAFRNHRDS